MAVLQGNVALVTGGGRGIGRAICVGLAAAGATVIVNDLHDDGATGEVVAEIVHSGGRALALLADVASAEQVEAMVAQVVETCGRIDILVNNAGVIVRKPMLETTDEDWRRVFGANIDGCFHCTRAVARHMVARGGGGQIVNISSTNAAIGGAQRSAYAATKGAIESFTRCCALELAPHGIAVNAVSPGFTITDINAQLFTPTMLETLGARLAAGRVAEAHEIASTVVAVASGTLPYLVGQVIRVDGGWSSCDVNYTTTHMSAQKQ